MLPAIARAVAGAILDTRPLAPRTRHGADPVTKAHEVCDAIARNFADRMPAINRAAFFRACAVPFSDEED